MLLAEGHVGAQAGSAGEVGRAGDHDDEVALIAAEDSARVVLG